MPEPVLQKKIELTYDTLFVAIQKDLKYLNNSRELTKNADYKFTSVLTDSSDIIELERKRNRKKDPEPTLEQIQKVKSFTASSRDYTESGAQKNKTEYHIKLNDSAIEYIVRDNGVWAVSVNEANKIKLQNASSVLEKFFPEVKKLMK